MAPDRAQLEAIRAQAMAIIATADALLGVPDERCCENPQIKVTETYETRTEYCVNCRRILKRIALVEPNKGDNNG